MAAPVAVGARGDPATRTRPRDRDDEERGAKTEGGATTDSAGISPRRKSW